MYDVDQNFGVFEVDVLIDVVTKVECVAATAAIAGKNTYDPDADRFGHTEGGKQVEVTLQGGLFTGATVGFANVAGSV